MKLIIDIPEEKLNVINNKMYCGIYDPGLYKAIANGIPLDDVKAKVQDLYVGYRHGYEIKADVLQILDNIGKAESEGKVNGKK